MGSAHVRLVLFLALTLFSSYFSIAQTSFKRLGQPFDPSGTGSKFKFADLDGDGYEELITLVGQTRVGKEAILYKNNDGIFTVDSSFAGVGVFRNGDLAFFDVEGDGDLDLFITGDSAEAAPHAKLFINDGAGQLIEDKDQNFTPVYSGGLDFADVDGDKDYDLLITGLTHGYTEKAILYLNMGDGTFTEVEDTPFTPVFNSTVSFSDVDGDKDQDVLLTGGASIDIAKLYLNDGLGNFSLDEDASFEHIRNGATDFADIDRDGDLDLIYTGFYFDIEGNNDLITTLYENDGEGHFSELNDTSFEGLFRSVARFLDIDDDGDSDLFLGGKNNTKSVSKLYLNDGNGHFTESESSFLGVDYGSFDYSDLDNDGDLDILISGYIPERSVIRQYNNLGNGNFELFDPAPFQKLFQGDIAVVDVDGDKDQDVFLFGLGPVGLESRLSGSLYLNNGQGAFELDSLQTLRGLDFAKIAAGDLNGDGFPDLIASGSGEHHLSRHSNIYLNDKSGNFLESSDTGLENISFGSIALGDIDGDKDLDLFLNGQNSEFETIGYLYVNDGDANFSKKSETSFLGGIFTQTEFLDVDQDKDSDLLLTEGNSNELHLYVNDGEGEYTLSNITAFDGFSKVNFDFSDIDQDKDQDLLIHGVKNESQEFALLVNDGLGNFTESDKMIFPQLKEAKILFIDIDNDSQEDLLLFGKNQEDEGKTFVYVNRNKTFVPVSNHLLPDLQGKGFAGSDLDLDGDQDLFLFGQNGDLHITSIYLNELDLTSPVFVSTTSVDVAESSTGSFYTAKATDNRNVQYLLGDGKDENLFEIDAETGELKFKNAPDFENPGDRDSNNIYEISINASDGRNVTTLALIVTVQDLDEDQPSVSIVNAPEKTNSSFSLTFQFSEEINGFEIGDIEVSNGNASGLKSTTNNAYSALISPSILGSILVDIPAGSVTDVAGNSNTAASQVSVLYEAVSGTQENMAVSNQAPSIQNEIPDVFLQEGFGIYELNLSGVFKDDDGDGLIYTITKVDSAVLGTRMSETTLTLSERGLGSSLIELEASDGRATAKTDFNVTVEPLDSEEILNVSTPNKTELVVYPNPTSGHITIHVDFEEFPKVVVYDLNGKSFYPSVERGRVKEIIIDVTSLQKGIYLLKMELKSNDLRSQLFIKK